MIREIFFRSLRFGELNWPLSMMINRQLINLDKKNVDQQNFKTSLKSKVTISFIRTKKGRYISIYIKVYTSKYIYMYIKVHISRYVYQRYIHQDRSRYIKVRLILEKYFHFTVQ